MLLAALATIILVHVWRIQDLFPILGTVQLPLLGTVVATLRFVYSGGLNRLQPLLRDPTMRWATLLLMLMVLGVPFSLYPGRTVSFLALEYSHTLLVMVLLAAGVRSFRDAERLMLVFLAGAVLFAFVVLTRFELGEDGRLGDLVYYDANDLGMLMVIALPMAVYWLRAGAGVRGWHRLFALGSLAFIAITLARTGSRGAFLGLIGVAGFLFFRFSAVRPQVRLLSLLGAFAILSIAGGARYWEMMRTLLNPKSDYNWSGASETGRMEVWKRGVGYMARRPIYGVGASCFGIAEGTISRQAAQQEVGIGFKWSAAHNSYVQVGAEVGVGGLISFLFMLGSAYRLMMPRRTSAAKRQAVVSSERALSECLAGSLIGFMIAGFFLSQAYGPVLYVLLGLVIGLGKDGHRPHGVRRLKPLSTPLVPLAVG